MLVVVGGFALVVAACSGSDDAASTATDQVGAVTTTAVANTSTTATPPVEAVPVIELTETYELPGFGYSIDYPSGWVVRTNGTQTAIAETEEQVAARLSDSTGLPGGVSVGLDHRTVAFLQGIELTTASPTPEDLLEFNISEFSWTKVRDQTEVELFGVPAVAAQANGPGGFATISYQGVRSDSGEVFFSASTRSMTGNSTCSFPSGRQC